MQGMRQDGVGAAVVLTCGSSVEECGKMDNDAPESTKKQNLFCLSWQKIKFLAG
jgi:hypothetical protein